MIIDLGPVVFYILILELLKLPSMDLLLMKLWSIFSAMI